MASTTSGTEGTTSSRSLRPRPARTGPSPYVHPDVLAHLYDGPDENGHDVDEHGYGTERYASYLDNIRRHVEGSSRASMEVDLEDSDSEELHLDGEDRWEGSSSGRTRRPDTGSASGFSRRSTSSHLRSSVGSKKRRIVDLSSSPSISKSRPAAPGASSHPQPRPVMAAGEPVKVPGRGGGGSSAKRGSSQAKGKTSNAGSAAARGNKNVGGRTRPATRARHSHILTPTDHEDTENALNRTLKSMGLYASKTIGDGNCMFRALSDQLYGHDRAHAALRQEICDYLEAHPERYEGFVDIERSFKEYVAIMRENRTYGGHLELTAFARLKARSIKVVLPDHVYVIAGRDESPTPLNETSDSLIRPLTPHGSQRIKPESTAAVSTSDPEALRTGDKEELEPGAMLYLSYHIFEHYSSVRNLSGPHSGLPRVKEKMLDEDYSRQSSSNVNDRSSAPDREAESKKKEDLIRSSLPPDCDPSSDRIAVLLRQNSGDWEKVLEILLEEHIGADSEDAVAAAQVEEGLISQSNDSGSDVSASVSEKPSDAIISTPAFSLYRETLRGASPFASSDDTITTASEGFKTPQDHSSVASSNSHETIEDLSPAPQPEQTSRTSRKRPLTASSVQSSPVSKHSTANITRPSSHVQSELKGKAKRDARKLRMQRSRRERIESEAWGAGDEVGHSDKRTTRSMAKDGAGGNSATTTAPSGLHATATRIKELYI